MEHRFYCHLADVFTRFCMTMGQLNPDLLTDYIPHIHLERQLIYLGMSFSARYFYHHLLAGPCIFQCSFCAIVAQFQARIDRKRHCTYCRSHRRLFWHTYRRNRIQLHPRSYNMYPCRIVPVNGIQSVVHLSHTHTCNLHHLVTQFIPANFHQHALQTDFLVLLQLNTLTPYSRRSRFHRHLANM